MAGLGLIAEFGLEKAQYNTLKSLAASDFGADRIYQFLRGTNQELPRQTVRDVIGRFRDIIAGGEKFSSYRPDKPVPERYFSRSSANQRSRYSYEIKFNVRNKDTGLTETIDRNLSSDVRLSNTDAVQVWLDQFSEEREGKIESSNVEITGGEVVNGTINTLFPEVVL